MIAIIDYGAGNLFSVKNALAYIGLPCAITSDAQALARADKLILPGVGAFPDCMARLRASGLAQAVCEQANAGKPLLGICLGMQMLFERSAEFGDTQGLALIPGRVERLAPKCGQKVPHMGWNKLEPLQESPLLRGLKGELYVYFVHSYAAHPPRENLVASCGHGGPVTALVQRGRVFGAQFHPEKSGEVGLEMLKRFGGLPV